MSNRPRIDPTQYALEKKRKIELAKQRRAEIARKRSMEAEGEVSEPDEPEIPARPRPSPPRSPPISSSKEKYSSPASVNPVNNFIDNPQWLTGPLNPEGTEFDPACFEKNRQQSGPSSDSDRPSTCLAINQSQTECCIGSSDHASYTISTRNAEPRSRLYSRNSGHMDWVSAACYLSDNRVMTGGMDGKVCLWRRGGSDCRDLYGEQGSVSVLCSLSKTTPIAASAGYDGSVIVWNCSSSSPSETKIENRRKQLPPITAFCPDSEGNFGMSGSNNGLVSLWDLNQGTCLKAALGKHGSQVQHVMNDVIPEVFFTAGVDGKIGMFDTRGQLGSATGNEIGATVSTTPFTSPSRSGAAPISGLQYVDDNHILTSGGNSVALLDTRMNMRVVGQPMGGHQKPVASLCLGGGGLVSFSGSIDGMVIAHNLKTMQPIYGMGANKKSASFLGTTDTRLIVTGDDGHALLYAFS